jgi:hypothetical protein
MTYLVFAASFILARSASERSRCPERYASPRHALNEFTVVGCAASAFSPTGIASAYKPFAFKYDKASFARRCDLGRAHRSCAPARRPRQTAPRTLILQRNSHPALSRAARATVDFSYSNTMKQSITLALAMCWEKRLTAAQRRFTRSCETSLE